MRSFTHKILMLFISHSVHNLVNICDFSIPVLIHINFRSPTEGKFGVWGEASLPEEVHVWAEYVLPDQWDE